jgi:hypothetical protein
MGGFRPGKGWLIQLKIEVVIADSRRLAGWECGVNGSTQTGRDQKHATRLTHHKLRYALQLKSLIALNRRGEIKLSAPPFACLSETLYGVHVFLGISNISGAKRITRLDDRFMA